MASGLKCARSEMNDRTGRIQRMRTSNCSRSRQQVIVPVADADDGGNSILYLKELEVTP